MALTLILYAGRGWSNVSADPGLVSTSFTYSPTSPTPGAPVFFSGLASGGSPPYSFSWNFGDGATSGEQSPSHDYAEAGVFYVGLTATDSAGGSDSISDTIMVVSGTSASWNPNVPCNALVVTIEQVRAITLSNPGVANHRQLDQPCTVTGKGGMEFSVLVQINGVKRVSISENDWSATFAQINGGGPYANGNQSDTAFNIYNPSYTGACTSASDQNCYHRIFTEIDRDWKAAGYCGPGTVCDNSTLKQQTTSSTLIDVQGFLNLNSQYENATWHSLTAWDLHPVTAWRVSQPPDFEIAASGESLSVGTGQSGTMTITAASLNGFSGDVSFSAEVTAADTTGSLSPSKPTAQFNPASLAVPAWRTGTSVLTVSASLLTLPGTYTVTVTATSGAISHTVTVTVVVVLL